MAEVQAGVVHQVNHVFARTPDLWDPSGALAGWFTEPPGAWVQFVKAARGSDELSEWLTGPALDALLRRYPRQALVLVLDLRLMRDRDLSARARILQTGPALQKLLTKVVVLPSLTATPALMASLSAGAKFLRCFGIAVEIETSVPHVFRQLGLRASAL